MSATSTETRRVHHRGADKSPVPDSKYVLGFIFHIVCAHSICGSSNNSSINISFTLLLKVYISERKLFNKQYLNICKISVILSGKFMINKHHQRMFQANLGSVCLFVSVIYCLMLLL